MAAQLNLEFANNEPWNANYQMTLNGAPFPLVGAALNMQLRPTAGSDEVALDLSTVNGLLQIIDGPNGIWGFNVSVSASAQVVAGSYVHDMIVTPATGPVFRPYFGNVTVDQGVTRGVAPWQT